MRGDLEAVRALLKQGADVNAAQGDGMTALHWAAMNGNVEMAKVLMVAGANLEAVTRIGDYTPLHLASKGGKAPAVRALLAAGSNAKATTTTGNVTPLHFAAAAGSREAVLALLDRSADVNARESSWGQTPLMFAAGHNRVAALKTLLARGADPSITSNVVSLPAQQALDQAAERRRNEVLAAFRASQAPQSQSWRPSPSQVQAAVRAAHEVQRSGVAGEVEEAAPDPSGGEEVAGFSGLVGTQGGFTALLHAAREGYTEAALALIDAGARINQVSAGDHTSPLLMAVINGHFDLALQLLERGADANLASDAGAAPLFSAINTVWAPKSRYPQQHAYMQQKATYQDLMQALLVAGADPNARLKKHIWYMSYTFDLLDVDTRGATPFWRAAYATDVEAMQLLVAYGADPNIATAKPPERARRGGGGGGRGGAQAGGRGVAQAGGQGGAQAGGRGGAQTGGYGGGGPAGGPGGGAPRLDPSGLPPVPADGPAVWPIHAASGVGYGEGYAGNAHRHVPDAWLPAVKYLVEELGADVNARDHNGYTPLHHAAARGDNELILYLVEKGADVTAVSRRGQTTADMANGPVQRISPFPATVALLEKLGSKNNHRCMSC